MLRMIMTLTAMVLATPGLAAMEDDPLTSRVTIDKLELRSTSGPDPIVLDVGAWIGYDLHKLLAKAEIEHVDGGTEEAELQLLYSRAVAAFWDFQVGWRHDFRPKPERDFLVLGIAGLAPYMLEVDTALFLGESGQMGIRLDAEYEYLFTQRLALVPEVEVNAHGKSDEAVGVGSGLSDMTLGLRLRYEVRRELAPYVGINWTRKLGSTADLASVEGEQTSDVQIVAGLRAWF
jgi:copper resistance protein B